MTSRWKRLPLLPPSLSGQLPNQLGEDGDSLSLHREGLEVDPLVPAPVEVEGQLGLVPVLQGADSFPGSFAHLAGLKRVTSRAVSLFLFCLFTVCLFTVVGLLLLGKGQGGKARGLTGDIPPVTEDEHHSNLPQKVYRIFSINSHKTSLLRLAAV